MAFRSAHVLKSLKAREGAVVELVRGQGYWYFTYVDEGRGLYDSHTVMVPRLSDHDLTRWVQEGQSFIEMVEST
nr:hypothetical protein [Brevundimonas naejangsanensis]